MTSKKLPSTYPTFLAEIKQHIRTSQYAALKSVNTELLNLYWEIGRTIAERQEKEGWGAAVIDKLAEDLRAEFPAQSGFSRRNLYNIRDLYVTYKDDAIVQPMVAQIGWTHNIMILEKCKSAEERTFYIAMTKKFGWTKNVLAMQISTGAFARMASAQSNFDKTLPAEKASQAQLAIKDEYTFDFLELEPEHSERELERALLSKVNQFLTEMGGMFTFVGSQYRLQVDGDDFFIDLLLYHRPLRCFVAVELKITEFKPSYAGQMQFYLTALNDTHRLPDESPAIGIILCREKKRTIVEYALASSNHPVGVASYTVSKKLPKKLEGQLPTSQQIEKLMDAVYSDQSQAKIDLTKTNQKHVNLDGYEFVQPMVAQIAPKIRKSKVTKQKATKSKPTKRKTKS